MKMIIHTNPVDGSLLLTTPCPKEWQERVLGRPLTDQQYLDFQMQVLLREWPDAINPRFIDGENNGIDTPHDWNFREAWADVTPEPVIDIDLAKSKEIKLSQMRLERQKKFEELGFPFRLAPELEEAIVTPENKAKLKALRDATEPLKALNATGHNDETILEQIRQLGKLNVTI